MLSYQHGYHAGHFTDVVKHLVLVHILTYMTQKEKPLFYLETHAGRGVYPLKAIQAQKTKAFKTGILPLWAQKDKLPPEFTPYLDVIKTLNPKNNLEHYPGSPYFALQLLRPIDRLMLCELHPQEFEILKTLPKSGKRIQVVQQDGLLALKSQLPPLEKRGLIFLDPSFEVKTEYQTLPKAIAHAYQRFPQGVFCLWYPILKTREHQDMLHKLKAQAWTESLQIEFSFPLQADSPNLCGTGLWILNPPYTLEKKIAHCLDCLNNLYKSTTCKPSFALKMVYN